VHITLKPTYKQHLAYEALKTKDIIFFGGGAGGGKSWWLCESRLEKCYRFPGYRSFIGREELKRLMQSTYVTWEKVCLYHKIPRVDWKLNGQYNYIEFTNGSRIDLLDLKFLPSDPLYERFGSVEFTDGAIEEAGEIHFLAYDVLKSRVNRHLNQELGVKPTLAVSGNPKKNWTYKEFYKPWKDKTLPEEMSFIQSLYNDNPYTADDYGRQLSSIKDKATKQRLMLGNWEYEDDPATLIEYDAIVDLFSNTAEESESKYMSVDVARYGQDKTVFYFWKGLEVFRIDVKRKQGLDVTAQQVKDYARDEKIPHSHIVIDEDGIGGGVVDTVGGVKGFVANSTPIDVPERLRKERTPNYASLKAQCTYLLADKINNRRIAIKTEDEVFKDELVEELEQIKAKDMDKDGKLKIVGKEETKELLGRSPDYADALMMRMVFELKSPAIDKVKTYKPRW